MSRSGDPAGIADVSMRPSPRHGRSCSACGDGIDLPFDFSMAFQPIVDVERNAAYAYEALVRGIDGEPASTVLRQIDDRTRYAFDQTCRVKAITLAAKLGLAESGASLSINFMPGAVYSPGACIQLTLKTARSVGFPTQRLIFEIVESEEVRDRAHLRAIIDEYRGRGFRVAIDDFGAGHSGLNLLADLPADIVKLDMGLIRDIERRSNARAIVAMMVRLSRELRFHVVAEGVETMSEYAVLRGCGVSLMQGFLFAKPGFETLPAFVVPGVDRGVAAG